MGKYTFKPYSSKFNELYHKEESKLKKILPSEVKIEHIGSTAVPGLGGKGVIDIAVYTPQERVENYMRILERGGYEYSPHPGDKQDKFMQKIVKSGKEERRVHVHLTLDPNFWNSFLNVRDYLREHIDARDEYARIKQEAATHAADDGNKYRNYKAEWIKSLARKADEEARQKGKKHQLETIVTGGIALLSFLAGGFLLSANITSKAIESTINSRLNWIGGILFLIGSSLGFIWLRRIK